MLARSELDRPVVIFSRCFRDTLSLYGRAGADPEHRLPNLIALDDSIAMQITDELLIRCTGATPRHTGQRAPRCRTAEERAKKDGGIQGCGDEEHEYRCDQGTRVMPSQFRKGYRSEGRFSDQ